MFVRHIETNWYAYKILQQELLYGVVVSIRGAKERRHYSITRLDLEPQNLTWFKREV